MQCVDQTIVISLCICAKGLGFVFWQHDSRKHWRVLCILHWLGYFPVSACCNMKYLYMCRHFYISYCMIIYCCCSSAQTNINDSLFSPCQAYSLWMFQMTLTFLCTPIRVVLPQWKALMMKMTCVMSVMHWHSWVMYCKALFICFFTTLYSNK